MQKKFRLISILLSVLVLSFVLTSCSSGNTGNNVSSTTLKKPGSLTVSNISSFSLQDQVTFTSIEGIINRQSPNLYLIYNSSTNVQQGSAFWLTHAVNLPYSTVDPMSVFIKFKSVLKGLIIWDPNMVVDTQNVAVTLAGLKDAIPCSPQMAQTLEAAPYNFKVLMDLRTHHFTNRFNTYKWLVNYIHPEIKKLSFPVWIGDPDGSNSGDDPSLRDWSTQHYGIDFEADANTDTNVLNLIFGLFPKDSPVYGYIFYQDAQYKKTNLPILEGISVGDISKAGDYLVPTDGFHNLSVFSQLKPVKTVLPMWNSDTLTPNKSKTYVLFATTDGDNMAYDQGFFLLHQLQNPNFGKVPLGISVSVNLARLAPTIYQYYLQHSGSNDIYIAAPSGAGYAYPSMMPNLSQYLASSKKALAYAGLKSVWILDNEYESSPSQATVNQYGRILDPAGIFADYDNFKGGFLTPNPPAISFATNNVPVVHDVYGLGQLNTVNSIEATAKLATSGPGFVFVGLDAWNLNSTDVQQMMAKLGPNYVAVTPDQFVGLIKGAQKAHEISSGLTK